MVLVTATKTPGAQDTSIETAHIIITAEDGVTPIHEADFEVAGLTFSDMLKVVQSETRLALLEAVVTEDGEVIAGIDLERRKVEAGVAYLCPDP